MPTSFWADGHEFQRRAGLKFGEVRPEISKTRPAVVELQASADMLLCDSMSHYQLARMSFWSVLIPLSIRPFQRKTVSL